MLSFNSSTSNARLTDEPKIMSGLGDVRSPENFPTEDGYERRLSSFVLQQINYDFRGEIQLLHVPRRVKQRQKEFCLCTFGPVGVSSPRSRIEPHVSDSLEKQVIDGSDLRLFKVRWDLVIEVLVAHFGALNWKLIRLEMVSTGRYHFLHR